MKSVNIHKNHLKIALFYFLLSASLGLLLRSVPVFKTAINYKFVVHTHSHIALLGWVYIALTTFIYSVIRTDETDKKYQRVFWFTQLTIVGMLVTFPFQGYGLYSIIFSTLFLFASYWFYGFFLKNSKASFRNSQEFKCLNMALLYMVVSSLGPWCLGIIMNLFGPESVWYRLSIYFYLHFQYNGWMILALVGLFIQVLKTKQVHIPNKTFNSFFLLFNLGIVLSFLLSALFTDPPYIFHIIGGFGVLFQLIALSILVIPLRTTFKKSNSFFSGMEKPLLYGVGFLLLIKMILQLLSAFPYFANIIYTSLDFIIGYLHWTFLGVISLGIFFLGIHLKLWYIPSKWLVLYIMGFIITETLIFYRGFNVWLGTSTFENYFEALSIGSLILCLSLVLIFLQQLLSIKK